MESFMVLLLSFLGAIVMYPAVQGASPGDSDVFYYVLGALFIVGLGFSLQQTAANPFAISLGDVEKGSHRLNLAGGINSLGYNYWTNCCSLNFIWVYSKIRR